MTGNAYLYRVSAQNEIGLGLPSPPISVIAGRAPDAPQTTTLNNSTVQLIDFSWQVPYDGGSTITYYKIWFDEGSAGSDWTLKLFTEIPINRLILSSGLTGG